MREWVGRRARRWMSGREGDRMNEWKQGRVIFGVYTYPKPLCGLMFVDIVTCAIADYLKN